MLGSRECLFTFGDLRSVVLTDFNTTLQDELSVSILDFNDGWRTYWPALYKIK
jgi:hypothetical protein